MGGQVGPALHLTELVRPERQVAVGGDLGVLLAQAAGGGVARVHERARALGLGLLVEPGEARHRHVHLAPHLEHVGHGRSGEAFRDDGDGGDVRRHVLAHAAVTTCGRLAVAAALVAQAHRQAVDLQLADVGDGLVGEAAGDARAPRLELRARHRVVEAHHRLGVHDRGEQGVRRAADLAGERVVELDVGVVGGELAQLADQRVEVAVGDLGVVESVVAVVVVADELGQLDESRGRVGHRVRQSR